MNFSSLREQDNSFVYQSYEIIQDDIDIILKFNYKLQQKQITTNFYHKIQIKNKSFFKPIQNIQNIVFHIGLIEAINYWKIATPKKFFIKCANISDQQLQWFKKLYYNGLGEFLYLNKISITQDDFVNFIIDNNLKPFDPIIHSTKENNIIPIGGGKDSIVTYELLKDIFPNSYMFSMNPIVASQNILNRHPNNSIVLKRQLDMDKILQFNKAGYLNGHIPFSSIVGFISIWLGLLYETRYIVLSNEESANEENVVFNNLKVNHQYSKSFEFENDFREYIATYITKDVEYFSFLRPLQEINIAELFAQNKEYFDIFLSCNVGSKKNIWCNKCPKCMFTYIMLCNFIDDKDMIKIFGTNMLDDITLKETFNNLYKSDEVKPFECVGTYNEINYALQQKIKQYNNADLPILLKHYENKELINYNLDVDFTHCNLPEKFKKVLQDATRIN
jgi:hypothetical protein